MEDLSIHPLLKVAAREPAEPRPARQAEDRGFDREFQRAANTTAPPRPEAPSPAQSNTPAKDEASSTGHSATPEREQNDDTTSDVTVPADAQPDAPPTPDFTEQPVDTIELTVPAVEPLYAEDPINAQSAESAETAVAVAPKPVVSPVAERQPVDQSIVIDPAIDRTAIQNAIPVKTQTPSTLARSSGNQSPLIVLLATETSDEASLSRGSHIQTENALQPTDSSNVPSQLHATAVTGQTDVAIDVPTPRIETTVKAEPVARQNRSRDAAVEVPVENVGSPSALSSAPLQLEQPQFEKRTVDPASSTEVATVQESTTADAPQNEPTVQRGNETTVPFHRAMANRVTVGVRSTHSSTDAESRIDTTRFVGRVAGAFRVAQERGGVLQLRLSPPELGSIKLELLVERGVLTARIEAETSTTRKVLLDNLPALRERLAQQEIRVDRFDVDVRQDGAGSQPDWQARERHEHRPSDAPRQHVARRSASTPAAATPVPSTAAPITDGRLNVLA
jgi:flagellar hook-length control protein FliK